MNQSINQSTNQSINQSIKSLFTCSGQVVNLVEADPEVAIVVTKAVQVAVEGLVEADIAIHPPQDPGVGSGGAMFTADLPIERGHEW